MFWENFQLAALVGTGALMLFLVHYYLILPWDIKKVSTFCKNSILIKRWDNFTPSCVYKINRICNRGSKGNLFLVLIRRRKRRTDYLYNNKMIIKTKFFFNIIIVIKMLLEWADARYTTLLYDTKEYLVFFFGLSVRTGLSVC